MWRRLFARSQAPARSVHGAAPARRTATTPPGPLANKLAPDATETPLPAIALVEDRFYRLVLGLPQPSASEPAGTGSKPAAHETATLRRLGALSERFDVHSLPRLPTVLPQLLRALRNEHIGGGQLAHLIGRDPVLVGELMRVTGSAHYRTAQPIHSLQHAVVLLGHEGLRRIATQHAMKPILQASAGMHGHMAGTHLWDHAERCAHGCAHLGRVAGCEPFEAYLAGMVCHAGSGAIVRLLDQEARPADAACSPSFLAGCMQLGARLSRRAAEHWQLPANVVRALTEREEAQATALSPLGKTLQCADILAIAQLLGEHHLLDAVPDYSPAWPELFPPPVLQRCQQDLQRQFPVRIAADGAAGPGQPASAINR